MNFEILFEKSLNSNSKTVKEACLSVKIRLTTENVTHVCVFPNNCPITQAFKPSNLKKNALGISFPIVLRNLKVRRCCFSGSALIYLGQDVHREQDSLNNVNNLFITMRSDKFVLFLNSVPLLFTSLFFFCSFL